MLHRPFQMVQIHRTQAMRQRHVQQFMFWHDRFALEDMGDGMVQSLVFHQSNSRQARLNEPTRGVFRVIAAHRLTIATTAVRALPPWKCL